MCAPGPACEWSLPEKLAHWLEQSGFLCPWGWSQDLAMELVSNKLSQMSRKALLVPWDSFQKADWVAT